MSNTNTGKKLSIYERYFNAQEKYGKIYGDKSIVFFQMGKFYDAYCSKTQGYANLEELEKLLNIKFIRRDHLKKGHHDYQKPNQFGIPTVSIQRNLTTMVDNGYTIILFDQVHDGEDIERECIGVFSPGTYLSDRQLQDANYNLSVYIVDEKQLTGQKTLMAIGLTLVDITTGTSMVHEFYSNKMDERFGLDELIRIMQTFRPTETIIYYQPVELDEAVIKNIKLYLELDKFKNLQFYIYHNKKGNDKLNLLCEEMFKINYQNEYLSNIFELNSNQLSLNKKQSAIEIMGLEKKIYVIISLMIVIRYLSAHNVTLLKNLSHPEVYLYNKHLILGNNAIEQLNILDSGSLETYNRKIKSLFDVINKTMTPMGKRFLKENLLNPLSQENKAMICDRYDMIDALSQNNLYKTIKEELKNICDMERLHRKMAMGIIVPYEFYRLDIFYQATTKIITYIKDIEVIRRILPENIVKEFVSYRVKYDEEYDFEKAQNYHNFTEIDFSFFKPGIHSKIDKIQENIDYVWSIIDATNDYFTELIKSKNARKNYKDIIDIETNDRDGYYFTVNKTNEKILKTEIEKQFKKKKGKITIELSIGKTLEISEQDIIYKGLPKGRTKIFITPLIEHTLNLSTQKINLTKLIKKIFIKSMVGYYQQHKKMFHLITRFIAQIDFLVSGAIVAAEYYYCKPKILSSTSIPSYLQAKDLRHAIIERLSDETEHIPNDIELGNVPMEIVKKGKNDKKTIFYENSEYIESNVGENMKDGCNGNHNGILLFGLNGSGKCLAPDTKVMMVNGTTKQAKDIKVNDNLMGDDSSPRKVLSICKGKGQMYKIVPVRGDPYIVNGPHILCLKSSGYKSITWGGEKEQRYRAAWMQKHKYSSKSFSIASYGTKEKAYEAAKEFLKTVPSDKGKIIHISVDDYLKKPAQWRINYYTYHVGIEFVEQEVTLDPYIVGHWLGDGDSAGPRFTSADHEIVDYYKEYFDGTGITVKYMQNYHYAVTTNTKTGGSGKNWFTNALNEYNLINNKHIPHEYLCNSRENQLKLLAGLIDSDGSNDHNRGIDIIQKNERLADDIVFLARSLGFFCEKKKCTKTCTNSKNGPVTGTYYRMYICGNDFTDLPLLMEYKRPASFAKASKHDHQISSFKIVKMGMGDYCGFELDGNHRFLLGDMTVTHNSSLMKSIGIATILAQIGYYVPASEFTYEPYMALYARITGNDNIFKGLSSFALEMTELDAILLRTESQGPNTLVIGDEVCRGTEDISGRAIVASALVSLSECSSSFIFSSHLHDIQNIEEIKQLKNLRMYNLRVEYDEENDCLIFDRKLTLGSGPSVYGLMVAKYLIKNKKFINRAEIIKKRLMAEDKNDIPLKTSKYNKDLLIRNCLICGYQPIKDTDKELESHHIHFQKDCWADGKIKEKPYLNKNRLSNLVILCRKCHTQVHQGEIVIKGYVDTSIGPLLDYIVNTKKKITKNLDQLEKLEKTESVSGSKTNNLLSSKR